MDEPIWTDVDEYLVDLLALDDDVLRAALADSDAAGLPAINVAANQGKLLELLAKGRVAKRILEIGTLGGFSAIFLARALPTNGALITLEVDPKHAAVARKNLDRAGVGALVDIRVGSATGSLRQLIAEGAEPFDFVFIDADKESYPEYLALSLQLSRAGTLIVADNVVRDGKVVDPESPDSRVQGIRAFLDAVAAEDRVEATAVQTVGTKGYDGFALLLVTR